MAKKSWAPCPIKDKAFDYSGDKLAKAWPKLHAGDQEPFPDETHVDVLLKANPKLGKDAAAIAADLQEAWRDFHRGEFQRAPADLGTSILADRQANRPLEWDIRNGVIQRYGRAHGIPVPISDVIVPLLAAGGEGPG